MAGSEQQVYVVRHGETAWSLSGQRTGVTDIPLTENGRAVARYLHPILGKASFSLVLTSPLRRARETCELAGLGDRAAVDPGLMEWNYGEYEGLTPFTAEQVAGSRSWYSAQWHYDHEPEIHEALDLIFADHFSRGESGVFAPLRDTLLTRDHYMHLADLTSYLEADRRLGELYADPDAWARKAILNVASSGRFSSDRTIAEYTADIWKAQSCPVE